MYVENLPCLGQPSRGAYLLSSWRTRKTSGRAERVASFYSNSRFHDDTDHKAFGAVVQVMNIDHRDLASLPVDAVCLGIGSVAPPNMATRSEPNRNALPTTPPAVDDDGARAQPGQGLDDQREAIGEVKVAVLAGDDAEAVVLDLVQPRLAARRLRRFGGQAGRDEAEG